jgi:hypothetical protein
MGNHAGQSFLARLELLSDVRIAGGHLFLTGPELLDSLPHGWRSRAIHWRNCVNSGDGAAAVGAVWQRSWLWSLAKMA